MYLLFKPTGRIDILTSGIIVGYIFYNEETKERVYQLKYSTPNIEYLINKILGKLEGIIDSETLPDTFSVSWWGLISNELSNTRIHISNPTIFDLSEQESKWKHLMNRVKFQWIGLDKIRVYRSEYMYGKWSEYVLWYEGDRLPEYKVIELLREIHIDVEEETIDE